LFILEDIICRWGCPVEFVTDNAPQFLAAVAYLESKYGIKGIRVSPYNSQGNGKIENGHFPLCQSLYKATGGNPKAEYSQCTLQREAEAEALREQLSRTMREHAGALEAVAAAAQTAEADKWVRAANGQADNLKDEIERLRRQIHELQQESADKEVNIVQITKQRTHKTSRGSILRSIRSSRNWSSCVSSFSHIRVYLLQNSSNAACAYAGRPA
jgi:hypothetical protein